MRWFCAKKKTEKLSYRANQTLYKGFVDVEINSMSKNIKMAFKLFLLVVVAVFLKEASGHGMMLQPPGRSSLWRYDSSAPVNVDDNQVYCGGIGIHWQVNKGKCGVCGDRYDAPHPQDNENTGKYGQGKIAAKYSSGSVVTTSIKLSANHMGTFEYSLCNLQDASKPEQPDCFQPLTLEDGSKTFPVPGSVFQFSNKVRLPAGLKCDRCVLRWVYKAANNWGSCEDGSWGMGCGPQEHFYSCADIQIV